MISESIVKYNNINKHRLDTSSRDLVACRARGETGSVRALQCQKEQKEQVIVGGSFSRLEQSLAKPLKLFETGSPRRKILHTQKRDWLFDRPALSTGYQPYEDLPSAK